MDPDVIILITSLVASETIHYMMEKEFVGIKRWVVNIIQLCKVLMGFGDIFFFLWLFISDKYLKTIC